LSGAPTLSNTARSDGVRRLVHLSFGGCALLLDPLGRPWSLALAGAALAYNVWLAPALGLDRAYRRAGEGRWSGLATYPLAVLLLVLLAPLQVAAGAWVVLAAADPVAAAVGTRAPRPRLPYNPRKSLPGTLAGLVAGAAACWAMLAHLGVESALVAALCGGGAGAAAESLPLRDDNLAVAAAAALALAPTLA